MLIVPYIANERLQQLSLEEREKGLFDLHGVSEVVPEPSELITKKLEELEVALAKINDETSLQLEKQQSEEYTQKIRIKFLRADSFNATKAANRMLRFFEVKRGLFGEDKLTMEIGLYDCTEKAREWLEKGSIQVLPQRDRAGRAVLIKDGLLNYDEGLDVTVSASSLWSLST